MDKYNYKEAVENDVREYIKENITITTDTDFDELQEQLNNDLWTEDSVTGNASGSYTMSTWKAEENLCHNFHLLRDAMEEFDLSISYIENPEHCDITIRCYLLYNAINDVLNEIKEELKTGDNA